MTPKSSCCGAEIYSEHGCNNDTGRECKCNFKNITFWSVCKACDKACDFADFKTLKDIFIRDCCSAIPRSKSEMRRRLDNLLKQQENEKKK